MRHISDKRKKIALLIGAAKCWGIVCKERKHSEISLPNYRRAVWYWLQHILMLPKIWNAAFKSTDNRQSDAVPTTDGNGAYNRQCSFPPETLEKKKCDYNKKELQPQHDHRIDFSHNPSFDQQVRGTHTVFLFFLVADPYSFCRNLVFDAGSECNASLDL